MSDYTPIVPTDFHYPFKGSVLDVVDNADYHIGALRGICSLLCQADCKQMQEVGSALAYVVDDIARCNKVYYDWMKADR